MKNLVISAFATCIVMGQTLPALADMTSAQRQQIERARSEVREAIKTDEGCKAMCEEILSHKKSKKMLCEMMKNDPEAMKMMKMK